MQKMGMNPADFNMGGGSADPEIAELEKMMKKQGKTCVICSTSCNQEMCAPFTQDF